MLLYVRDNVLNLHLDSKIGWCKGNWGLQSPENYLKHLCKWPKYNHSSYVPEPDNSDCMHLCVFAHEHLCPCILSTVCAWFPDWHYFCNNDDLILVPISYLVADIPRIDSFGHKARQKDEVQNCVLLTSAAYALQEDVQGWDSLLQCHELRGRW